VEVYDEALQARVEERAEMALAMRDAIARGELVMHLQPIVDLATLRPIGAEALARWCRPGFGQVPPTEFVAVAENSSLIIELTRLMLSEACGRLAAWRRADPDCSLWISVNLSSRHLVVGDLVGDLAEAIAASGADPRMLELELTETQLLADFDTARQVLETVRASGVTVAVDDFGTGFSSMAYLRQLQVDAIKVDRSFVAGAGQHGFDSTAIDAMVNFGRVLGIEVVAEGVETHEQLEFVRSRGCTRAQGYLFGRPMPPAEAEKVLGISRRVRALAGGGTLTSGDAAEGEAPTVALHAGNAER
jgi:EAL domain-containing protein (putative c-di-GMP-specific phosphodiesterase class I)